jgi:NADPH:quinone reductase-like Zn-dependent oxidoreductase
MRAFTLDSFDANPALRRLAELLDAGTLRVPIEQTYRLGQAGEALQSLPTTHTQGKLSLTIA